MSRAADGDRRRGRLAATLLAATMLAALAACEPSARTVEDPPATTGRAPLVTKVEHFYATAPDAERLFHLFRDTLGLTQVWPYQVWGDFASGGVTLGNVVFELVWWKPEAGATLPTELSGIALEPVGGTDSLVAALARRGIAHAPPDSSVQVNAAGRTVGWTNTMLTGMLPEPRSVFVCDYADREMIAAGRRRASDSLAATNGGPLGVLALREIVLGVTDVDAARAQWGKLVDAPPQAVGDVVALGAGPQIRLVPSAAPEIQRLVVQVRSLEQARAFLAERRWLGESTAERVTIAPAAIGGLRIELVP